jgi:hypothetical protein
MQALTDRAHRQLESPILSDRIEAVQLFAGAAVGASSSAARAALRGELEALLASPDPIVAELAAWRLYELVSLKKYTDAAETTALVAAFRRAVTDGAAAAKEDAVSRLIAPFLRLTIETGHPALVSCLRDFFPVVAPHVFAACLANLELGPSLSPLLLWIASEPGNTRYLPDLLEPVEHPPFVRFLQDAAVLCRFLREPGAAWVCDHLPPTQTVQMASLLCAQSLVRSRHPRAAEALTLCHRRGAPSTDVLWLAATALAIAPMHTEAAVQLVSLVQSLAAHPLPPVLHRHLGNCLTVALSQDPLPPILPASAVSSRSARSLAVCEEVLASCIPATDTPLAEPLATLGLAPSDVDCRCLLEALMGPSTAVFCVLDSYETSPAAESVLVATCVLSESSSRFVQHSDLSSFVAAACRSIELGSDSQRKDGSWVEDATELCALLACSGLPPLLILPGALPRAAASPEAASEMPCLVTEQAGTDLAWHLLEWMARPQATSRFLACSVLAAMLRLMESSDSAGMRALRKGLCEAAEVLFLRLEVESDAAVRWALGGVLAELSRVQAIALRLTTMTATAISDLLSGARADELRVAQLVRVVAASLLRTDGVSQAFEALLRSYESLFKFPTVQGGILASLLEVASVRAAAAAPHAELLKALLSSSLTLTASWALSDLVRAGRLEYVATRKLLEGAAVHERVARCVGGVATWGEAALLTHAFGAARLMLDFDHEPSDEEREAAETEVARGARRLWRGVVEVTRRLDRGGDAGARHMVQGLEGLVYGLKLLPSDCNGFEDVDPDEWAAPDAPAAASTNPVDELLGSWCPEKDSFDPWVTGKVLCAAYLVSGSALLDSTVRTFLQREANTEGWMRKASSLEVSPTLVQSLLDDSKPEPVCLTAPEVAAMLPRPSRTKGGVLHWVCSNAHLIASPTSAAASVMTVKERERVLAARTTSLLGHVPLGGAGKPHTAAAVTSTLLHAEVESRSVARECGLAGARIALAHAPHDAECAALAVKHLLADGGSTDARMGAFSQCVARQTHQLCGWVTPATSSHLLTTVTRLVASQDLPSCLGEACVLSLQTATRDPAEDPSSATPVLPAHVPLGFQLNPALLLQTIQKAAPAPVVARWIASSGLSSILSAPWWDVSPSCVAMDRRLKKEQKAAFALWRSVSPRLPSSKLSAFGPAAALAARRLIPASDSLPPPRGAFVKEFNEALLRDGTATPGDLRWLLQHSSTRPGAQELLATIVQDAVGRLRDSGEFPVTDIWWMFMLGDASSQLGHVRASVEASIRRFGLTERGDL